MYLWHSNELLLLLSNASWTFPSYVVSHCISQDFAWWYVPCCWHSHRCHNLLNLCLRRLRLVLLPEWAVKLFLLGIEDVCYEVLPLLPRFYQPSHGKSRVPLGLSFTHQGSELLCSLSNSTLLSFSALAPYLRQICPTWLHQPHLPIQRASFLPWVFKVNQELGLSSRDLAKVVSI
jgi:hypothetical protein